MHLTNESRPSPTVGVISYLSVCLSVDGLYDESWFPSFVFVVYNTTAIQRITTWAFFVCFFVGCERSIQRCKDMRLCNWSKPSVQLEVFVRLEHSSLPSLVDLLLLVLLDLLLHLLLLLPTPKSLDKEPRLYVQLCTHKCTYVPFGPLRCNGFRELRSHVHRLRLLDHLFPQLLKLFRGHLLAHRASTRAFAIQKIFIDN